MSEAAGGEASIGQFVMPHGQQDTVFVENSCLYSHFRFVMPGLDPGMTNGGVASL
jgi:hypothetical protein